MLLALHTGMRASELLGLRWDNVDIESGKIIVENTKHHRTRYIPMNNDVKNLLMDEIPRNGEHVFSKEDGSPYGKIDRALASAVELAGIPKCTLHDFRATWATELIADGVSIETVRQLGGWRDYTTILRYVEAIQKRTEEAVKKQEGKYSKITSRLLHGFANNEILDDIVEHKSL